MSSFPRWWAILVVDYQFRFRLRASCRLSKVILKRINICALSLVSVDWKLLAIFIFHFQVLSYFLKKTYTKTPAEAFRNCKIFSHEIYKKRSARAIVSLPSALPWEKYENDQSAALNKKYPRAFVSLVKINYVTHSTVINHHNMDLKALL